MTKTVPPPHQLTYRHAIGPEGTPVGLDVRVSLLILGLTHGAKHKKGHVQPEMPFA